MNTIEKLGASLEWKTMSEHKTFSKAKEKLHKMALLNWWNFVHDSSLFGGYYVDEKGDCYRVR